MTESRTSLDVRSSIVETFRGNLVGPAPQDLDLARERLNENPSRWYLTGFLAPADEPAPSGRSDEDDPSAQQEMVMETRANYIVTGAFTLAGIVGVFSSR